MSNFILSAIYIIMSFNEIKIEILVLGPLIPFFPYIFSCLIIIKITKAARFHISIIHAIYILSTYMRPYNYI